MEQIYRPILKQAWKITSRFKYLWFFGLFAAVFGSAGIYNINFSVDEASNQGDWLLKTKDFLSGLSKLDWGQMAGNINIWIVLLFMIMLGVGLFLLWLSIVSQGALIYGVKEANQGRRLFFGEVFAHGKKKFWQLLILNVTMALVALVILLIFSLPFLILVFRPVYASSVASLFVAVSFIVLVPLGVILSFVIRYSLIFIVNKERSLRAAMSEAWSMFRRNWLSSIELAVILWFIFLILGIVLNIIGKYLLLPLFVYLFAIFATTYVGAGVLAQAVIFLVAIIYLAVMLIIAAVLNVFEISAWVLFFEKLNEDEVESKIVRLAAVTLGPAQTSNLLSTTKEEYLPRAKEEKIVPKKVVRRKRTKPIQEE